MPKNKHVSHNLAEFVVPLSHLSWKPLRAIDESYKNHQVPRTEKQHFHENIWFIADGLNKPIPLNFTDYVLPDGTSLGSDANFGLFLFLKVRTFHLLQKESSRSGQPLASTTIKSALTSARSTLLPFLKECPINQFMIPRI